MYLSYKYNQPLYIHDVWYNAYVYNKESFPYVFDKDGKYIPIDYETLYPFTKLHNGKIVYYKIIGHWSKSLGGDWLYDSDRYDVDFKLESIH